MKLIFLFSKIIFKISILLFSFELFIIPSLMADSKIMRNVLSKEGEPVLGDEDLMKEINNFSRLSSPPRSPCTPEAKKCRPDVTDNRSIFQIEDEFLNNCSYLSTTYSERVWTEMIERLKRIHLEPKDIGLEIIEEKNKSITYKVIQVCTDNKTLDAVFPRSQSQRGYFYSTAQIYNPKIMNLSQEFVNTAKEEFSKNIILNTIEPLEKHKKSLSEIRKDRKIEIPTFIENPVSKVETEKEANKIVKALLKKHGSLVIGEKHSEKFSKKLILNNLDFIKSEGAVLALEHILYRPYQKLLDHYLSLPVGSPMPPLLKQYLHYLDMNFDIKDSLQDSYTAIIEKAKEKGVRVIAIDTFTSYNAGSSARNGVEDSPARYNALAFSAKKILERELSGNPNPKVVFLVGSGHVSERRGAPGMSEIMGGAPTLVVHQDLEEKNSGPKIRKNVDKGDDDVKADIFIEY